jgi:serine/threonine protein kinase
MIENDIVANKYIIQKQIGNGKFGTVYLAKNKKNNELLAIKTEPIKTAYKILKHETTILKYLYDHGARKVPMVYWYGLFSNFTCLAMPLYESSLNEYILCNDNIEIIEKKRLVLSMLNIIECIHKLYILHRDIKPQNFMLKGGELFIIDFGFSAFYVDESTNHVPIKRIENIIGTPKYVSYFVHDGFLPSRRDDLISIGYIYMFLLNRELPWDTLKKPDILDNYEETNILNYKNQHRKALKQWDYIKTFKDINGYIDYCYKLDYHETPNYDLLIKFFSDDLLTISK